MGAPQDGGPAFPQFQQWDAAVESYLPPLGGPGSGMSLRDWFAGQVCAAIMCAPVGFVDAEKAGRIAAQSYVVADAMLAARKRGAETKE